jgi:hypothetical protein
VSRQVDGATPQPVQKMTCDELLLFVVKQQSLTNKVVTCYEAGAFEFHLHRRLEELGIKNYVVQPQDCDERGKGVKNDRLEIGFRMGCRKPLESSIWPGESGGRIQIKVRVLG